VLFQPQDWPELWELAKGRQGLDGLKRAKRSDVVKMLLPKSIRDGISLKQDNVEMLQTSRATLELEVIFGSREQYHLWLDAKIDQATGNCPAMLKVSDYEAKLPTEAGTQAFYQNLSYQLGHMDIPVIFGSNSPDNLGYFMHRLGRIPIALMADQYAVIRDRICKLEGITPERERRWGAFDKTIQMYGCTPEQLIKPEYRDQLAQLKTRFDAMSARERSQDYPQLVQEQFGLTEA